MRIISFSGVDGSGKTTQAQLLTQWLTERGFNAVYVHTTKDKGQSRGASERFSNRAMRLLNYGVALKDIFKIYLFTLRYRGKKTTIITDRYYPDIIAKIRYRGVTNRLFERCIVSVLPQPSVSLLIQTEPAISHERDNDHTIEYHQAKKDIYSDLSRQYKELLLVDGSADQQSIHQKIRTIVQQSERHVVLLSHRFPPNCSSGGGIYVFELARFLTNNGFTVDVITGKQSGVLTTPIDGLTVHYVASDSLLRFPLLSYQYFKKNLAHRRTIVHGNHVYHWIFALRKGRGIHHLITTTHNSYLQRIRYYEVARKLLYPPLILLESFIYARSKKIIAVSELTAQYVRKYPGTSKKISVIPNGVIMEDYTETTGPAHQPLRLLFVGRLDANKNISAFVSMLPAICNNLPVSLTIVGNGEMRQKLEQLIDSLNLRPMVTFTGILPREKVKAYYHEHDVFVLPSRSEGLPFTLLEAAASGMALLTSRNATGLMPLLKPGINGYYIDLQDAIKTAHSLQQIAVQLPSFRQASRSIIKEQFTLTQTLGSTQQIYSELAE